MEPAVSCARDHHLNIAVDGDIELRGVCVADCAELYASIDSNRARLREWLPWVRDDFNPKHLLSFLDLKESENESRVSLTTHIRYKGKLCGAIGLHNINQRDRNSSIGYWLDHEFTGRGIMTRACRALVTEGFRHYGLHRIEIRCATANARSSAIPRRLGFKEEGRLREAEWLYDHWVDLFVFSMLRHDWKDPEPRTGLS
jgi:ribosomal-protein-serine acetyltransferase